MARSRREGGRCGREEVKPTDVNKRSGGKGGGGEESKKLIKYIRTIQAESTRVHARGERT